MKYFVLSVFLLPFALYGRPLAVPALPESVFADTESSTNIVIDASDEHWSKLDVRLTANATISNNVQIAFGTDINANGILELIETDTILGWDSGAWFLKDERADWTRQWSKEPRMRELAYSLRIIHQEARALKVLDGDEELFDAVVPDIPKSLFDPNWNLLRITSRGKALRDELVSIKLIRFGILLEIR